MAAEIRKMFPGSYQKILKINQDRKIHQFDLSSTMTDIELMVSSTKNNIRRELRKLSLRKKYVVGDRLTPATDIKIWKYEVKSLHADLLTSTEKSSAILKILTKLKGDSARAKDDLKGELSKIKLNL